METAGGTEGSISMTRDLDGRFGWGERAKFRLFIAPTARKMSSIKRPGYSLPFL